MSKLAGPRWLQHTLPTAPVAAPTQAVSRESTMTLDKDGRVVSIWNENATMDDVLLSDVLSELRKPPAQFIPGKWITESDLISFEGGVAVIQPKIPYRSVDAGKRTESEEWQQSVRDRMQSQSFAERLPLP